MCLRLGTCVWTACAGRTEWGAALEEPAVRAMVGGKYAPLHPSLADCLTLGAGIWCSTHKQQLTVQDNDNLNFNKVFPTICIKYTTYYTQILQLTGILFL